MPPRRWVIRELLGHGAARLRDGATALPPRAWRRWTLTVAVGFPAVLAFAFALARAVRAFEHAGALAWEADCLREIEAKLPFSFSSAVWIQTLGTDITLALLVAFAAGLAAWNHRPLHALTITFALVGLDLAVRLTWVAWDRARPDVILDGIAAPGFASFPSGHTAKSVAVYGTLALFWARATHSAGERVLAASLALAAVLLVMAGRLRMGVHWPTDVLGGALTGAAWLAVLGLAFARAERAGTRPGAGARTVPY